MRTSFPKSSMPPNNYWGKEDKKKKKIKGGALKEFKYVVPSHVSSDVPRSDKKWDNKIGLTVQGYTTVFAKYNTWFLGIMEIRNL